MRIVCELITEKCNFCFISLQVIHGRYNVKKAYLSSMWNYEL